MREMSGSGPFGVDVQMLWLGQPAQASPWPARLDSGPGQCSGSGAMRGGGFFSGAERSTLKGSSSVVVAVEDMIAKGTEKVLTERFCVKMHGRTVLLSTGLLYNGGQVGICKAAETGMQRLT